MEPLSRRGFLLRSGLVAGAGAVGLTGCTSDDADQDPAAGEATGSGTSADLSDWAAVRDQFALDPELAHFAAFVLASHPAQVRDAIDRFRDDLDRDTVATMSQEIELENAAREAAAQYLGVAPDEVALTDSTTMGLGLTYHGLTLRADDHVVTSTHDFYATHEALRLAAAKVGAEVERIPLYDDPPTASAGAMVDRIRAAIRPATRLVALTWVHSSTGVKLPAGEIAAALAEVNASRDAADRVLFGLDAVHGLGAETPGPGELGCDMFIAGTHKWLFGPRGTGIVWVRRDAWDRMTAVIPTFSGPSFGNWFDNGNAPFVFGLDGTPGGFHSFEHRWALADAFEFHQAIGKDRVAAKTADLATRLKDGLAELSHVGLVTPRDPGLSSGIVCCDVTGRPPAEVVEELQSRHRIVASVTPYQVPYVRFGPSIVTSTEEVDAVVQALASMT
jgi:selenocysteine lyase/cysteine desulfurase